MSSSERLPGENVRVNDWAIGAMASTWSSMKFAQGGSHINNLISASQVWAAEAPISTEQRISDDRLTWNLHLLVRLPPPVQAWSLMVGDAVHNLRSGLDALIWELATHDGKVPPKPNRVQFPIVSDAMKWNAAVRENLQTVDAIYADRIEKVQPFMHESEESAKRSALTLLQYLSNLDKHRSSIGIKVDAQEILADFQVDYGSVEAASQNVPPDVEIFNTKIEDDALIAQWRAKTPILETRGGFGITYVPFIETPVGQAPLLPALQSLHQACYTIAAMVYGGYTKVEAENSEQ